MCLMKLSLGDDMVTLGDLGVYELEVGNGWAEWRVVQCLCHVWMHYDMDEK